jgi:hypothetical protein
MKVVINSLFLQNDLRTIKLASLYCNKIVLPDAEGGHAGYVEPISGVVSNDLSLLAGQEVRYIPIAEWGTAPGLIRTELNALIQEGILILPKERVSDRAIIFTQTFDDIQDHLFLQGQEGILKSRFEELDTVAIGDSPCVEFSKEDFEERLYLLVQGYFSFLTDISLSASTRHSSPILTDSLVVNELLQSYLAQDRLIKRYNVSKLKTTFLTQEVLQEFLPGIKDAPIDEILEVRFKMRNELEAFRIAMSKLSSDIQSCPWNQEMGYELNKIIETKVKPSVHELKNALEQAKWKALERVFENLKNPATYVPLVGTLLSGVQPSIALLSSVGLASFKAIYDSLLEKRATKNANGLVFLLKARRKFARR